MLPVWDPVRKTAVGTFCLGKAPMEDTAMKDECLICKAPLEYLETDELMECAICHRKENSKPRRIKVYIFQS